MLMAHGWPGKSAYRSTRAVQTESDAKIIIDELVCFWLKGGARMWECDAPREEAQEPLQCAAHLRQAPDANMGCLAAPPLCYFPGRRHLVAILQVLVNSDGQADISKCVGGVGDVACSTLPIGRRPQAHPIADASPGAGNSEQREESALTQKRLELRSCAAVQRKLNLDSAATAKPERP